MAGDRRRRRVHSELHLHGTLLSDPRPPPFAAGGRVSPAPPPRRHRHHTGRFLTFVSFQLLYNQQGWSRIHLMPVSFTEPDDCATLRTW